MKQSKFSETEIQAILREGQGSGSRADVCKKHGISVPTFYVWRAKYGLNENRARNPDSTLPENKSVITNADSSLKARVKELEAENQLLKRLFVEMALECEMLKGKVSAVSSAAS